MRSERRASSTGSNPSPNRPCSLRPAPTGAGRSSSASRARPPAPAAEPDRRALSSRCRRSPGGLRELGQLDRTPRAFPAHGPRERPPGRRRAVLVLRPRAARGASTDRSPAQGRAVRGGDSTRAGRHEPVIWSMTPRDERASGKRTRSRRSALALLAIAVARPADRWSVASPGYSSMMHVGMVPRLLDARRGGQCSSRSSLSFASSTPTA